MSGYVEQIRSYRPDLVTLEETAPWDFDQFLSSGVFDHLPYRFTVTDNRIEGIHHRQSLSNRAPERCSKFMDWPTWFA